jgi:hypothetical protein
LELEREPSSRAQNCLWLFGLLGILSVSAFFTSKRKRSSDSHYPIHPKDNASHNCSYIPPIASDPKANAIPPAECKNKAHNGTQLWEKISSVAQAVIALVTVGLLEANLFQIRTTRDNGFGACAPHNDTGDYECKK